LSIGQVAPTTPSAICIAPADDVETQVPSGPTYDVPPPPAPLQSWMVSSWSTYASPDEGQLLAFKVFRRTATAEFKQLFHDGPQLLAPAQLNTFPVTIPVRAGDLIGVNPANAGPGVTIACVFIASGMGTTEIYIRSGSLSDGETGTFNQVSSTNRVNVSAVLEPNNIFTLGQLGKNTRNGTATQKVFVPNPGTLRVVGKGVAKPTAAKTAVKVTSARTVKVPIRATGTKRKRLNAKGAVKVAPTITFTPTDGAPRSVALRVKLLKKT
jgi:hypothetical protein